MKTNVKKFASIFLALAMLFSMCAVISASAAETQEAVGAGLSVSVRSNFCESSSAATISTGNTITVTFTSPVELDAVDIQWGLNYDKTKLQLTGVTAYTQMMTNPNATSYTMMGSVSNIDAPTEIAAGGTMFTFKFKALAEGETEVYLHVVDLMNRTDSGDKTIVENGVVKTGAAFTVVAASNFFAGKTETIEDISQYADASGNIYVTVEYKLLGMNKYLINLDIDELTYDPAVLEWTEDNNLDMFPFASEEGLGGYQIHKTDAGRVVGNYSNIDPAAYAFNEDGSAITAVKATFKVLNPNAGTTTVTCNADVVSYCDTSVTQPYMQYIAIDKKVVNAANKAKATYETTIAPIGSAVLIGDVNMDGVVNIQDATALQRYLAEYNVNINLAAADTYGDGKVNIRDVSQIQRYVAQYISSFR